MPKFRNISPDTLAVGAVEGPTIGPNLIFEASGTVVGETDDAYLVKVGGPADDPDVRAWPKSVWKHVGALPDQPAKSATKAEWVTYAEKRGLPDADAMTKDELVAEYDAATGEVT